MIAILRAIPKTLVRCASYRKTLVCDTQIWKPSRSKGWREQTMSHSVARSSDSVVPHILCESCVVPEGTRSNFPLYPALARWAKLSRPCGAGFEMGLDLSSHYSFAGRVLTQTLTPWAKLNSARRGGRDWCDSFLTTQNQFSHSLPCPRRPHVGRPSLGFPKINDSATLPSSRRWVCASPAASSPACTSTT